MNTTSRKAVSVAVAIVLRYQHLIVGLIVMTTIAAAVLASGLRFDNSIQVWFLEDDPELVVYKEFPDLTNMSIKLSRIPCVDQYRPCLKVWNISGTRASWALAS